MASPFPQTDTLTAEQYHRLRNRPASNGALAEPLEGPGELPMGNNPTTKASGPLEPSDPVPALQARVCRRCGTPLDGPASKIWCSNRCRARARSAPTKAVTVTSGPQAAPMPAVASLVTALVAGPGWTQVTISFDGVTVTVTPRS